MKYMQTGGFQSHPLMKLTLNFTLLFIAGLWVSNLLIFTSKMGFSPGSIEAYYLGSEAEFSMPRTTQSMLEVTHVHLPIMAIVILMLTHLLIFAPFHNAFKVTFISASFLSAFVNEMSGWLIRFVHPQFSYLKLASFVLFQGLLLFLIYCLGHYLWSSPTKKRKAKKGSNLQK